MTFSFDEWSENTIQRVDPEFKHRWEVYNNFLFELLDKSKIWLDCGCGNNEKIREYGKLTKLAFGIDLIKNEFNDEKFVKGNLAYLPVKSSSTDLITLRFVVEHFDNPSKYFDEFARVLNKNGKILVITTNLSSPFILLPKYLLTNRFKNLLITKLFKVRSDDVFVTYHMVNNFNAINSIENFKIIKLNYLSDLNTTRKWMFLILLFWHFLTKPKLFNKFRTNIITVLERV